MKIITSLILTLCFLYGSEYEDKLILHGISYHFDRVDEEGNAFNEFNYGVGYQLDSEEKDNVYYTYTINVIEDSYYNPFYFVTGGIERTLGDFSIGIHALVGYKKVSIVKDDNTILIDDYSLIGGVIPGVKYFFGDFSLNYYISPDVTINTSEGKRHTRGFHYFSLSYSI